MVVNYISASLYRKMVHCALAEGMAREDLEDLSTPIAALETVQAVPADHFFELHEKLDDALGRALPSGSVNK